ncbi:MAG: hypothetical protein QXN16_01980 [Candidatus Micrarchaeaceae archaeon]
MENERKHWLNKFKACAKSKSIYVLAFLIYFLIAIAVFYPITSNISTKLPGVGGDTYQNVWDIWWVDYAIFTLHTSIWHTSMIFAPLGSSLVYQTMAPLGAILVAPFMLYGLVFSYNMMLLLGFAISAITMLIFADYFVKNKYAAFAAGILYSFSAFHIAQGSAHIDWIFIAWIPLALYFLARLLDGENRFYSSIGLGISFSLTLLMADIEQTIMLAMAMFFLLIIYVIMKNERKKVLSIKFWEYAAFAIVVAAISGAYAYVPIFFGISANGIAIANQNNILANNVLYSPNVYSFFMPSLYNSLFSNTMLNNYAFLYGLYGSNDATERISYIGYVAIALAAVGTFKRFRKAFPWIVIAIIFAWLALGPIIQIGNNAPSLASIASSGAANKVYWNSLYSLYHAIPFINVIREPGRFDIIAELAIAMLAAYGAAELMKAKWLSGRNAKLAFISIVSFVALIESAGTYASWNTTNVVSPSFYSMLAKNPANFTMLFLPALPSQTAFSELYPGMAMYYSALARKPLVGGYTTRTNNSQYNLLLNIPLVLQTSYLQLYNKSVYASPVYENYTNQTLLSLYNYNTAIIAVFEQAFTEQQFSYLYETLNSTFGKPLYSNSTLFFFTSNATESHIFRSYVAYPIMTDWILYGIKANNTNESAWLPSGYGAIIVYAPYSNSSGIESKIQSNAIEYINTTVSFTAFEYPKSAMQNRLYIDTLTNANKLAVLGAFNITSIPRKYTLNVTMISGPYGNTLLFMPESNFTYILFNNITFSRRT